MSVDRLKMLADATQMVGKTVKAAAELEEEVLIAFTDGSMARLTAICYGDEPEVEVKDTFPAHMVGLPWRSEKFRQSLVDLGICTAEEFDAAIARREREDREAKVRPVLFWGDV